MNRLLCMAAVCAAFLSACKPGTPDGYIQPRQMEDLLVDYHLAKAMAQQGHPVTTDNNPPLGQALLLEDVLAKHGVAEADFDSSLVYYYTRADRFVDIYRRVAERLEERALIMGATEGEIGKYSSLTHEGDTANIWADRAHVVLMPAEPYNRLEFEVEVDTTFMRGDRFLLQFTTDYMYQGGSKDGTLYLAVTYDNDTTVSRSMHFTSSGLSQMHFPENRAHDIKRMRGFFYLGGADERSAKVRLLFVNNIQLIRFHQKHEHVKEDSVSQDPVGGRLGGEAVVGLDSGGRGEVLQPIER